MSSVEDMPEHVVTTFEKRGAAPAAGILLFGLFFLFFALPVIGDFMIGSSTAALAEAEMDEGGGGEHH